MMSIGDIAVFLACLRVNVSHKSKRVFDTLNPDLLIFGNPLAFMASELTDQHCHKPAPQVFRAKFLSLVVKIGMEPDELRQFMKFPDQFDKPLVNLQSISQNKESST